MKLKVLDLFSGIGGFSIGLDKAGMETIAFCENDKDCQKVLKKNWPNIPIFGDVRQLKYESGNLVYTKPGKIDQSMSLEVKVDVVCGGFPCQDISVGGKGVGIGGDRSGLWKQLKRVINETRPDYAIIENVERLRKKGLGIVLKDLFEIGYNAEWHCITAASIGLPHQRDRIWIIAYRSEFGQDECAVKNRSLQADKKWQSEEIHGQGERCQLKLGQVCTLLSRGAIESIRDANANRFSTVLQVRRVVDGISPELDKIREIEIQQVGNAVVPQIPEMIGLAIIKHRESLNE